MGRNLRTTNANLLVALDALLAEESVTRAAERMGVTQSSMSATLSQLRELFDDPLLVRAGQKMTKTSLAARVQGELARGIAALDAVLAGDSFSPATSEEHFTLALSDRVEAAILPQLVRNLTELAPHASVQVLPWGSTSPPPKLRTGEIDVAVTVLVDPKDAPATGTPAELPPEFRGTPLFDSGLATIVRAGHPKVEAELALDVFCRLDHVLVTEGLRASGIVDRALEREGRSRRIATRVPRHTLVGELIAQTDMVATIDRRIAHAHARRHGLQVFAPPLTLPRGTIQLVWHERTDNDLSRRWLREQIVRAAATVDREMP